MGADRTLMQVKVRCGLGRVGLLGRLYGNSRGMSAPGQSLPKSTIRVTSAYPSTAEVQRTSPLVRFVPEHEIAAR